MTTPRIPTFSRLPACAGLWLALAATPAAALGLAAQAPGAVLGSPLDITLPIRVDAGEVLDPECVRAQVQVGDRRLPADAVRTRLDGLGVGGAGPATASLRVQTTLRLDEPIVELLIEAGCPTQLSRSYVIFADPPRVAETPGSAVAPADLPTISGTGQAAQTAQTAQVETSAAASPITGAATAPVDPAGPPAATDDGRRLPLAPPAAGGAAVAGPTPGSAADRPSRPAAAVPTPPRRAAPATSAAPVRDTRRAPPTTASSARATAPRAAPTPRLRLDPLPATAAAPAVAEASPATGAVLSPQALALVDQANEAVKAAIAELRASQARLAALEAQVTALNAQVAAERAIAARLQAQAAETAQRGRWFVPLALALAALLGLAAWMAWRLRALDRGRQREWLHAARRDATPASSLPAVSQPPPLAPAAPPAPGAAAAGRRVGGAGLAPAHQPTPSEWEEIEASAPAGMRSTVHGWRPTEQGVPPQPGAGLRGAQDVSTEELIDLEQQAEFFIVLGQDEAAVDLLMAHLRDSGGASPLPYLKLMEIYRRLGDEDAYRRTQDRFNQRFNAHAPAWEAREQTGRGLDGYPAVMAELQRVWPRPLDAMAELEALLFRRTGGAVFDLEAYRDLLFLYGIAREVHESLQPAPGAASAVDVLLPLDSELGPLFEAHPSGLAATRPQDVAETTGPGVFDGLPPSAPRRG
jgi:pilus assembly protein FimV